MSESCLSYESTTDVEMREFGAKAQEFVAFCLLVFRTMEKWFLDRVLVPKAFRYSYKYRSYLSNSEVLHTHRSPITFLALGVGTLEERPVSGVASHGAWFDKDKQRVSRY